MIVKNYGFSGLKSVMEITYERTAKEKTVTEKRYYISSLSANQERYLKIIRSHWGIENKLNWVLGMTFNEDRSRIRQKNAPINMAVIRHTALNMLRKLREAGKSLEALRKMAG